MFNDAVKDRCRGKDIERLPSGGEAEKLMNLG